jgi:hypothetical protein
MTHLREEELIDQAYGEGDSAAVKRHLEQCSQCATAYSDLRGDLAELACAEPPARHDWYGERVWQSLASSLPAYESPKPHGLPMGWKRGLIYAGACALLLICAFIGGRLWERKHTGTAAENKPQPAQHERLPSPPRERVVVVVLSDYLDRSERLLVELKHADAGSTEMVSPLREEARTLLAAHRLCRQDASKDHDPALDSALDRLDHLLDELANQPGNPNAADLAHIQKEMNTDGLLFEVRVLRSRVEGGRVAARTKGGTT